MSVCKEEAAYYLRFISMYIDLGSEVTRKVFIHHTPGKDAESFLLSNTSKLQQLKNDKILNKQESDLVLTSTPNLKAFDVSLLITLSINLFSEQQLSPPKKGWSKPPKNSDKSISADLLRLRTIRNLIVGHRAKAQLPEWRFKDEWENVEEIFLRIYRDIAPGEESHLKQRIEDYRLRKLDPSIENKYDSKLHEWQQQISEIQQQVEDAFKTVEDIDKYLKSKSDRYERYIKLLVNGGRFVILALIEDNLKAQNKYLKDILKDKEDYVRKIIDNRDHLHILYPPDRGNTSIPIDMSTWDITLLTTLLLEVLNSSSLDDEVKQAVNNINTARKTYAEAAVVSLDSDAFAEYSYPLKYSIQFLSRYLDSQKKIECEEILSECKNISKSADAHQTYFDELKKQSMKIKSIQDIYKDKIKKTKHVLQEMITHGIDFKNEHVLELKMITLGCEEEKKQLGENVLTDIWREALERSGDSTDFDVVKNEVLKILTEIRKPKGVTGVNVKQKCILLGITSCSPRTLLHLLNYFESTEFNQSLRKISSELGYLCNTVFTIQGNVTLESLEEIHADREHENGNDKGISIPITITSPAAVMQLRSFFKSEAMMNSTNAIADKLSGYLEQTVTLNVSQDMGPLNSLFDDLETEHSSSESLSDDAEHVTVPEYDSGSKTDVSQRISTLESSEEINKTELELCMQQEEVLGAVLYTELLEERKPCYASEICDRVPGLRRKQDAVARLLQIMCENGMAVNIRGKYILKENLPPELDENLAFPTCDGPVHGTTCATNQREVPVQQTTVQRSSSSDFSCDTSDLMVCTDILTKITDFLKGCSGSVKAKEIAQRTGIGQSRSDVNRYLYFLKNHNIIQDNGKAEWTLIQEVNGDDIRVYAAQLVKKPGGKSKGKLPQSGSSSSLCDCPNAGQGSLHVPNKYQKNIHHHHHNIQIGEHNQMLLDLSPDGAPPGGQQHH